MFMKRRLAAAAMAGMFIIASCVIGPLHAAHGVTVPAVTVSPNTAGVRAKYVVEFDLTAGLDKFQTITIQFTGPSQTVLPCTPCNQKIDQNHVFVNGINPVQEVVGNSTIGSIQVRTPVALAAGSHVQLVFDEGARIGNPTVVGTYAVDVWTETEPLRATSSPYHIGESQLESLTVHPDNDIAGATAGYLVTMATGGRGELVGGHDTLTLTFPSAMPVPSNPVAAQVTINGVQAETVSRVTGINALAIQLPVSVPSRSALTVAFLPGFGLSNPAVRGEYVLLARTTAEPGDVKSEPFAIVDRPAVSVNMTIEPLLPDGLDGWYIHTPVVTLTAQSNVPGQVDIVCGIDGDAAKPYVGQIEIPAGIHTLRFSATNGTAGISAETVEVKFRVALRGPVVTLSGRPAELVSDPSYVIRGSVEPSHAPVSSVDVQGKPTHVFPDGSFSETLALLEGKNELDVVVRDEAGLTTVVQREVTLDTVPPALTIDAPQLWAEIASTSVAVRGHVETDSALEVAGRVVSDVAADGSFAVPVSLTPGKNTITVAARDKAGNVRQMAIVVTCTAVPSHVVVLTVGKTVMTVDGASRPVDAGRGTVPVIVRGRTLVPISSLMNAVGGTAVWNAAAQTVTLTLGKNSILLTIGKNTAVVNGKVVRIDPQDAHVVPVIENGRTMLPLRFVGEALGCLVEWNATARMITVTYPAP